MSTFHYNFHELFERGGFVFAVQIVDGNDQTFGDVVSWQPFFAVRPWFRNVPVSKMYKKNRRNALSTKCKLVKVLEKVSIHCLGLFESCGYKEHIQRKMHR